MNTGLHVLSNITFTDMQLTNKSGKINAKLIFLPYFETILRPKRLSEQSVFLIVTFKP